MANYLHLNLIDVFTFYLWAMFFLSTIRRVGVYRDITRLTFAMPNRWPRVLQNMKRHGVLFMTWATFRPAGVALSLILIQMVCAKVIWPTASISAEDLFGEWGMIPVLLALFGAMAVIDGTAIYRVGLIDHRETAKYLDEAEHWLSSWKAPVIQIATLGYVNPRQMVDVEVRKAMEQGNALLQSTFWWMSMQSGARLLFGIALWLSWAIEK